MIQRIHHTALSTPDLARAVAFYRDLFGFEVLHEFGWPRGSRGADRLMALEGTACRAAMLRRGDSMLEIFEFSSPAPRPQPADRPAVDHGITHVCFLVDDIEAEHARLAAAGVRFHHAPQPSGGGVFAAYGRDPDGNVFELLEIRDPAHPVAVGRG